MIFAPHMPEAEGRRTVLPIPLFPEQRRRSHDTVPALDPCSTETTAHPGRPRPDRVDHLVIHPREPDLLHPDRRPGSHGDQGHRDQQARRDRGRRSEEHTSELQSRENLVCRLLLEKKKKKKKYIIKKKKKKKKKKSKKNTTIK